MKANLIKTSKLVLTFSILIYFFLALILPSFADIYPGQGPYNSPEGDLVPAWVNLTKGDMFFADGNQVFIVVNFSCSPPSVCNSSMTTTANFSQIGGSGDVAGVFRYNSSDGISWAIFEFNDTVNFTVLTSVGISVLNIQPKNITINATDANNTDALDTFIDAPVVLVNMSVPPGCPPPGEPLPPQVPLRNGTVVPISGCQICPLDYYDNAKLNATGNGWDICGVVFGGDTTNFTEVASIGNFSNFHLILDVPGKGRIEFIPNVSFDTQEKAQAIMEFAVGSIMSGGRIGMNETEWNGSASKPNLNLTARLTIYNATKGLGIRGRPQIFKYQHGSPVGSPCPLGICSNFSWDGENLTFVVNSWSDYGLTDAINVTLNSPGNYTYTNLVNINFTFIPEWNTSVTMQNCTLYGNFTGTWAANSTNQTVLVNQDVNGINISVEPNKAYIWNIYCYDTTSQYDLAEANWTILVDTIKPQWLNNITFPTSPTVYTPGQSYQFNITVTDDNSVSKVIFEFNNTNYTDVSKDGNVYYKILTDLPANPSGYSFKWYMNDTANNWNVTYGWNYVINKGYVPLHLAINSTESDQSFIYENITNTTGWSDVTGQDLNFNLYRDDVLIASSSPANEIIRLGFGTYTYVYNTSGGANYTSNSTSLTLTINKKTINIYLALNGTQSNQTYTYPEAINATAWKDPTLHDEGSVTLLRNGNSIGTGQVVKEEILLGNGTYNYSATFSATNYTATNILTNRFALVNKGTPDVKVFIDDLPSNKTVTYSTTVTIKGNSSTTITPPSFDLHIINISVSSPAISFSNTSNNPATLTVTLGAATYRIIYNTSGNANWTSASNNTIYLIVNKGSTLTRLFLNGTEGDKTYEAGKGANFTVTLNVSGKTVYLDTNITGWVVQSGTTPLFNYTILATLGKYNITGYFPGDANYSASSQTYYATVGDTTSPQWSNQVSNTSTPLEGATVNLSVYWRDNVNLSFAILSTNETGSWKNKTTYNSPLALTQSSQISSFMWKNSSITKGTTIAWKVYANDSSNNWNVTSIMSFTVKASDGSTCSAAIQCLGGYCVHGYCRSSAWYAGDGYCDSQAGETCSNSPQDCGVCPLPTPTQKITVTTEPGKGLTYINFIKANKQTTIQFEKRRDLNIFEMSIVVKTRVYRVNISIIKLEKKPVEVKAEVSGKVYRYISISRKNIREEDLSQAKIKFIVEKSWINENNIDPDTIALYRFSDNRWNKLNTTKISEDVDYVYYVSETPGLSYFAISGERKVAPAPTPVCGNGVCEVGENSTSCPEDCPAPCVEDWVCTEWSECINGIQTRTCTDKNECGTTVNKPAETRTCEMMKKFPSELIGIGLALIIIIMGILVWKFTKK